MTKIRDIIDSIANDNFDEARVALKTAVAQMIISTEEKEKNQEFSSVKNENINAVE